jgi:hypothetical protein
VFGHEWAIGKLFGPDPLMHEEHPFQRRSGKFVGGYSAHV